MSSPPPQGSTGKTHTDEIDQLRAMMARAHEPPDRFRLRALFEKLAARFRGHIRKKAITHRIKPESEESRKDAA